jgi:hypothetical protein
MLDTFKQLLANQYEAALCTLNTCIDRCPETAWDARVGNHAFCQVAFHALFYADLYLGPNEGSFRQQPFHRGNEHFFGDYEEFEDRAPRALYDKMSISRYVEHCRKKASEVIASETADSLNARSGFEWQKFSRAEVHVQNIRHIQHHAAQLSLRLRLDAGQDIPWVGSGWRNV